MSSGQLSPSRCTRTTTAMERYVFKIMSPGGRKGGGGGRGAEWIKLSLSSEDVASATMDSLFYTSSPGKVP